MGIIKDRIFFHHADVSVLGGHFTDPAGVVPVQGSLSLSPSGGEGEVQAEHFSFHNLISFTRGHSTVSGNYDKGLWITEATVTIEDLRILDRVSIKKLVSSMTTKHPEAPGEYEPSVSLEGSTIEGMRIDGVEIKVNLDGEFLKNEPNLPVSSARRPLLESADFCGKVKKQYENTVEMHRAALLRGAASKRDDEKDVTEWVSKRYAALDVDAKMGERGAVLCSIVKSIDIPKPSKSTNTPAPKFRVTPYGNIVEVEDLGRLFLGEIMLDRNTHRLIMLRAELGSSTNGSASAGSTSIEGRTWP